jgi:hypothetical protein
MKAARINSAFMKERKHEKDSFFGSVDSRTGKSCVCGRGQGAIDQRQAVGTATGYCEFCADTHGAGSEAGMGGRDA